MESQPNEDQNVSITIRWLFVLLIGSCLVLISFRVVELYKKVIAIQTDIKIMTALKIRERQTNHDSLQVAIGRISVSREMNKDSITTMLDSTLKRLVAQKPSTFEDLPPEKITEFMNLLLLLVGYCGGLGACVHILGSFVDFWGNGDLKRSWLAWYVAKPMIGIGLAIISFFLFQAGFFGPNLQPDDYNIHGILGMACLVGLFTDKASVKLSEIFDVIFKPKEDRKDPLEQHNGKKQESDKSATIKILKIEPEKITDSNAVTIVTIIGENLSNAEHLKVNDKLVEPTSIILRAADKISFKVGPIVDGSKQLHIKLLNMEDKKIVDVGKITVD